VGATPINGLAIATRDHVEWIQVPEELEVMRTLICQVHRVGRTPLLLVNVHVRACWSVPDKRQYMQKVMEFAVQHDADMAVIGDFNVTLSEEPLVELIQGGQLDMHDTLDEEAEPTRRNADGPVGRHIDFMLTHGNVEVIDRRVVDVPFESKLGSDHQMVAYAVGLDSLTGIYRWPKKKHLRGEIQSTEEDFEDCWMGAKQDAFRQHLSNKEVQPAWQMLSDIAEEMLQEEGEEAKGGNRATVDQPVRNGNEDSKTFMRLPVIIQRVYKLRRRIVQSYKEPWNHRLRGTTRESILKIGLRLDDLQQVTFQNLEDDLRVVDEVLDRLLQENRRARIESWRKSMEDERKAMRYVKGEVEEHPRKVRTNIHPNAALDEESQFWKQLWSTPNAVADDALIAIMEQIGIGRGQRCQPRVTGKVLLKICKSNLESAAGPDGWRYRQLALLPLGWHDELAALMNAIIEEKMELPTAWTHVRVALIPRPISVASCMWRLMGSALLRSMGDWIKEWVAEEVCGGIPGKEMDDILHRFESDLERCAQGEKIVGASIDLSKCFDREKVELHLQAMEYLGLDPKVTDLVRRFYSQNLAWFCSKGVVAQDAMHRINGMLQGCALSMILLAVSMTVFVNLMKSKVPSLQAGVFVDDRLLWSNGPNALDDVAEGVKVAHEFDKKWGRVWNEGKGICFNSVEQESSVTRRRLQKAGPCVKDFSYLGIEYTVRMSRIGTRSWKFKPARLNKVLERLARIRKISGKRHVKRKLVQQMALPCVRWGGQWRSNRDTHRLACAIERTVLQGKIWRGRSPALAWIVVLGHKLHPAYQQDLEAMQARIRRLRKQLLKRATDSVAGCRTKEVYNRWRWEEIDNRKVKTPMGVVDLLAITKRTLEKHAVDGWQHWIMMQDKRARNDQVAGKQPVLTAHSEYFDTADTWLGRFVAVGAAPDYRNCTDSVNTICTCGQLNPTRRHWTWHCSSNPAPSAPVDGVQEALGITFARRAAKHIELCTQANSEIVQALRNADPGVVHLGTDGSSLNQSAAGWAVALKTSALDRYTRISSKVAGADQTSYMAEVHAALEVLRANMQVKRRLHMLIDNLAVVNGIKECMQTQQLQKDFWLPKWAAGTWMEIRQALQNQPMPDVEWIPSHGKLGTWSTTNTDITSAQCRELNAAADESAGTESERQQKRYERSGWVEEHRAAEFIARKALQRLHLGVLQFASSYPDAVHPVALEKIGYYI